MSRKKNIRSQKTKSNDNEQENNNQPREKQDFALRVLTAVTSIGLLAIPIYAIQANSWTEFVSIISVGLLVAGAVLVAGSFIGFLFGIPRSSKQENEQPKNTLDNQISSDLPQYETNTNLEEISDWLTKILVGVGLTQLAKVPQVLQQSASFLADGLGGFNSSEVFAVAILIFFSVCGFLLGYLWTRVYLTTKLSIVDQFNKNLKQAREEKQQAQKETVQLIEVVGQVKREQEKEKISELKPESAREELEKLTLEYMDTRKMMPSGNQRTVAMISIMGKIMALCSKANLSCDDLDEFFKRNTQGSRIVVLGCLQEKPLPDCLDLIIEAITHSDSAFEQYQALRAAQSVLSLLNQEQTQKLKEVIKTERKVGYIKLENTGRWNLSEQILGEIRYRR